MKVSNLRCNQGWAIAGFVLNKLLMLLDFKRVYDNMRRFQHLKILFYRSLLFSNMQI